MADVETVVPPHPAKWTDHDLAVIARTLHQLGATRSFTGKSVPWILDPFAGPGRIHDLPSFGLDCWTFGYELAPGWAASHGFTWCGDARNMHWPDDTFDSIVTSPTFGNRMADTYVDHTVRNTYTTKYGAPLDREANSGTMNWGHRYRRLHRECLTEFDRVLAPGGFLVVHMRDHVRGKVIAPVAQWWLTTVGDWGGFASAGLVAVTSSGLPQGENWQSRVGDGSVLMCWRKHEPVRDA